MIIRYYGHALFSLSLESGADIVMDPYGELYHYPKRALRADVCTVSHHHFDHDGVSMLTGSPVLIDTAGVHRPLPGVVITGIPTFHDGEGGRKRGPNLIFVIEAEGLRVAHLGDLGHALSQEQRRALGQPDILMVPVGGFFTIDAAEALELIHAVDPRVAIPMHYKTKASGEDLPIAPVADFLALAKVSPEPMRLCRVTAEDIGERPRILLMTDDVGN